MIYNFVNLVSWKFVDEINDDNSCIYLDSISIRLLSRLFNVKPQAVSGIEFAMNYQLNDNNIFLLPEYNVKLSKENVFILPYIKNVNIFDITDIKKFINIHNPINVFIGISAPKQDYLAHRLSVFFPNINFYCLGAALNIKYSSHYLISNFFLKLNLNWLFFIIFYPVRTMRKIICTFLLFSEIILFKSMRDRFIYFINKPQVVKFK
jgi:UDP-N-acetyl-D-mannosaminuronic acid transferase (WecB/TagA/CpsF family)